jgi:pimeloyl-ACP methyl ester carboxylesterase
VVDRPSKAFYALKTIMALKEDLMKETVIKGIGCLLGQDSILQNRRTIVFVHGTGGSHQMWIPQMEYLSLKYNTVAINLPGHGLGQRKGETTIAGYVNAVQDFIVGLDLKNVVLAGLSMGGAITQEFALTYAERLSAIILFSTGAKLKVMPEIFEIIRNNFEAYISFLPQFAFAKSTPQEVIERTLEEARKCDPEVVYGDFQACNKFDLLARIKEIKIPCLIFSGTEDKLTVPKYQDYLHEQIPGSKLIRFENASHLLNLEKPMDVNKAIEEFVDSLPKD